MQVTENFKYLPFGGGRRKCIGDQFALFETIVTLAMLLRRYNFELAPGKPEVGMTTGQRSSGALLAAVLPSCLGHVLSLALSKGLCTQPNRPKPMSSCAVQGCVEG